MREGGEKQKWNKKDMLCLNLLMYVEFAFFLFFSFLFFPPSLVVEVLTKYVGNVLRRGAYNNHNMKQAAPSFFCFPKLKRVQNNNVQQQQQQKHTATECGGMLTF